MYTGQFPGSAHRFQRGEGSASVVGQPERESWTVCSVGTGSVSHGVRSYGLKPALMLRALSSEFPMTRLEPSICNHGDLIMTLSGL